LLLTQLPLLQTNVDAQDYHTLVLARDVNLFAVEFFDGRANRWTEEWIQTNQLPKAVRFALAFGQQARATQTKDVTMRLVLLGSSAVAADWQTPRGLGPGGAGGPAGPGGPGAPGVGPAGTGAATGDQTGTDQGAGARRWGRDGAADRLFPPPGAGGGSRLMPGRRP
jgi:hypothetical protein